MDDESVLEFLAPDAGARFPKRHVEIAHQLEVMRPQLSEINSVIINLTRTASREVADHVRHKSDRDPLTGEFLASATTLIATLGAGMEVAAAGFDAVLTGMSGVTEQLQALAMEISAQGEFLQGISESAAHPYSAQAAELRGAAEKCLIRGMSRQGSDRLEDWDDAMRLLEACTANPIASQDYALWFSRGWLFWKHRGDLAEAERSFDRARRLCADCDRRYYLHCLRHLSHMRYLQNNPHGAWDAVSALQSDSSLDVDLLFDIARYGALTGRQDVALDRIAICIDRRPSTIVTMLDEPDFAPYDFLLPMVKQRVGLACAEAARRLDLLKLTMFRLNELCRLVPCTDVASVIDLADVGDQIKRALGANYLEALGIQSSAKLKHDLVMSDFGRSLYSTLAAAEAAEYQASQEVAEATWAAENARAAIKKARDAIDHARLVLLLREQELTDQFARNHENERTKSKERNVQVLLVVCTLVAIVGAFLFVGASWWLIVAVPISLYVGVAGAAILSNLLSRLIPAGRDEFESHLTSAERAPIRQLRVAFQTHELKLNQDLTECEVLENERLLALKVARSRLVTCSTERLRLLELQKTSQRGQ